MLRKIYNDVVCLAIAYCWLAHIFKDNNRFEMTTRWFINDDSIAYKLPNSDINCILNEHTE